MDKLWKTCGQIVDNVSKCENRQGGDVSYPQVFHSLSTGKTAMSGPLACGVPRGSGWCGVPWLAVSCAVARAVASPDLRCPVRWRVVWRVVGLDSVALWRSVARGVAMRGGWCGVLWRLVWHFAQIRRRRGCGLVPHVELDRGAIAAILGACGGASKHIFAAMPRLLPCLIQRAGLRGRGG